MPDITPDQTLTPGQLLAGAPPPTANMPPYSPPQPPSPLAQPPQMQQQPAPTPEHAVAARHTMLGQVTDFLLGSQRDPQTGEPIKQPPGAVFRSLLAGALLGGAVGSESRASGGSVGGFLSGLGRGGNAVNQQNYQRQQATQEQARKQQEMSLEQAKFNEEKQQHQATLEHWNLEDLARAREVDYRDRRELEEEEAQEENLQRYAIENGAKLATIPHNGESGNGPTLMKQMIANPQSFAAPDGYGRLITKTIDFSGLNHDSKNGWSEDGKAVNWADHMKWNVFFVPHPTGKQTVSMTGAQWGKLYGVKGLDSTKTYSVESVQHLVAAATSQRKNERDDFNSSFREKHDALNATINSARTNITQYESEKRELLRQGYTEDDDEVQEINEKIADEQKRDRDAIDEMHPRIRERVTKQAPPAQPANTATPAPAPTSTPKKGDAQVYAGYTYTFDGSNWVKGKPTQ